MTTSDPDADCEYTLERTAFADRCYRDSEGYLHTGAGSAHVESVTITHVETR